MGQAVDTSVSGGVGGEGSDEATTIVHLSDDCSQCLRRVLHILQDVGVVPGSLSSVDAADRTGTRARVCELWEEVRV